MPNGIAIIGSDSSVLVFKSAGIDCYVCENQENAKSKIEEIKKSISIILITDDLAKKVESTLAEFKGEIYPLILPIPSSKGSNNFAMQSLVKELKNSLGVDILKDE